MFCRLIRGPTAAESRHMVQHILAPLTRSEDVVTLRIQELKVVSRIYSSYTMLGAHPRLNILLKIYDKIFTI